MKNKTPVTKKQDQIQQRIEEIKPPVFNDPEHCCDERDSSGFLVQHITRENMISSHRDFWARIVRYIRKTKVEDIPKTDGVSKLRIKELLQKINIAPIELTLFSISEIKCRVATEEEILLINKCYPCDYFGPGNCKICSQVLDLNCNNYGSAWHSLVYHTKTKKNLLKYAIQIRDCKLITKESWKWIKKER